MNTGDTAFMIISAALVMFMTPGLALFYGGMVREKNVLGTIMHSFLCLGIVTLIWIIYGYSLSFGPSIGQIIGGFNHLFLSGVGQEPSENYAKTTPHLVFMIYQCMFAIITPALATGAFAERVKFKAYVLFIIFWVTLVYIPMAHWVWGGGWMAGMGAIDFAGGAVVHMSSGFSALAAALVFGRRKGYGTEAYIPHNLPMTITGAAILWFGWFGFNAGSANASNGLAGSAFVSTHIAAAVAALSWCVMEWKHRGHVTTLGAASGAVAGLVVITPAAGYVTPMSAVLLGAVAGVVCYLGIMIKARFRYDDALDVFGIHGIGGATGALLTGLLATKAVNPDGADGLFYGNPALLGYQAVTVLATFVLSFGMTYIILKGLDATVGLRLPEEDEVKGMDLSLHSEAGYNIS